MCERARVPRTDQAQRKAAMKKWAWGREPRPDRDACVWMQRSGVTRTEISARILTADESWWPPLDGDGASGLLG
jgi:hypothetical protein